MNLNKLLMYLRSATLAEMYLDLANVIEDTDYGRELDELNVIADTIIEVGEANCGVIEFWQIVKELSE